MRALLRPAEAWHARVLADEVVSHTFSHGFRPDHTRRLAAYWAEALGGPTASSERYGDETTVVRIHSGDGRLRRRVAGHASHHPSGAEGRRPSRVRNPEAGTSHLGRVGRRQPAGRPRRARHRTRRAANAGDQGRSPVRLASSHLSVRGRPRRHHLGLDAVLPPRGRGRVVAARERLAVQEVRDAPDRPGREYVFLARRLA